MVGTQIGNYIIESQLGEGGFGKVYRAQHVNLPRYAALKSIQPRWTKDLATRRRFLQEAQTLAGLEHPNIVEILDYYDFNEQCFIIMEFIHGHSLRSYIRQLLPHSSQPFVPNFVVDPTYIQYLKFGLHVVWQVLMALQYAHEHQVIHRDVKPDNVMIDQRKQNRAVLMDFGLAFVFGVHSFRENAGGTIMYMAPEQFTGAVDYRSDIYSAGVMLYEMLAGRHPFPAVTPEQYPQVIMSQPPVPVRLINPAITPELEMVVMTALNKHPNARYQKCSDFAGWVWAHLDWFNKQYPYH